MHQRTRWSSRLGLAVVFTLLVALLLPGALLAAPDPNTPIPLPDLLIYGTATRNGAPVTAGTVSARLPRGGVVTAPIRPIAGTDYSYLLAIPLSQYPPGTTAMAANSAVISDTLTFTIDETPALFKDANGISATQFVVPAGAMGSPFVLNLAVAGADRYPLGDVNASGQRNSADAMLVLKYDIGLMPGDSSFPPAPGKIYLPLCDIVEDGQCNASDALRILQCDVGTLGISCPVDPVLAALNSRIAPTKRADLTLALQLVESTDDTSFTLQVVARDPLAQLGAATLELHYDPAILAPDRCTPDPDSLLGMATCNPAFAANAVRFNAITTATTGDTPLAEISFRILVPGAVPSSLLTLVAGGVFDQTGQPLPWDFAGIPSPEQTAQSTIYLPLLAAPGLEIVERPSLDWDVITPDTAADIISDRRTYLIYLPLAAQTQGTTTPQEQRRESAPDRIGSAILPGPEQPSP